MLKIVKPNEKILVSQVKILLYGNPGAGKTSLAFTANAPLLLDFDRGSHRAVNRKDIVAIEKWSDVNDLFSDPVVKDYQTIILDTAGRMLDVMAATLASNKGATRGGGVLTQNGYGLLKSMFEGFMGRLVGMGKDVILIAHEKEVKDDEVTIIRPDIPGGSYQVIKRSMDMIGFVQLQNEQRTLNFNSTEKLVGKNCTTLPMLQIPSVLQEEFDNYMATIIGRIKSEINSKSDNGNTLYSFKERIQQSTKLIQINELIDSIAGITDETVKRMVKGILANRVKELGFIWSNEAGQFVKPDQPAEKAEASEQAIEKQADKGQKAVAATKDLFDKK